MDAMQAQVMTASGDDQVFNFLRFSADNPWMPIDIFLIMLFISGGPRGTRRRTSGGGYIVQRMASAKDSATRCWRRSGWIAHYTVRPGVADPLVRRAGHVPEPAQPAGSGVGMPMIIREIAPVGIRGLILVAFFAAFMSTIATQINWGASYLVNDFYALPARATAT
jgi:hypothetical protein